MRARNGVVAALALAAALTVGTGAAQAGKTPPAPDTQITSGPSGTVASSTATFWFRSNDKRASFQCRLDGGSWGACKSPKSYTGLADGAHVFAVRAVDGGVVDPTPATASWTVDTTPPPAPSVDSAPPSPTNQTTASFQFSDAEAGATFVCSLDGAAAAACTSPASYPGLAQGTHTFAVAAKDAAGNMSQATSVSWEIDTTPPSAPSVTGGPWGAIDGTSATIPFADADAGVTFLCSLDGGAQAACSSPASYTSVPDGVHTFTVVAQDAAGNVSLPAKRSWSVQSHELLPNASFESGTSGWSTSNGTLTATTDAVVGSAAMKVALAPGATGSYSIFPSPRPVSGTAAGTAYYATAWIRSDTPGKSVCVRIREYDASAAQVGQKDSCAVAGSEWQELPVDTYTTTASGGTLTAFVFQSNAAAGDSFETDGVMLSNQPITMPPDPVAAVAGDIACAPSDPDFNGGAGTGTRCMQKATSDLIAAIPGLSAVFALGDEQYQCGELSNFQAAYDPTWGRFKAVTYPAAGNHEYGDSSACATTSHAEGYFSYFGNAAGDPTKGWYSFDIGSWHAVVLNSNCAFVGGCGAGSPQETWLRNDLAAHPALCTVAMMHDPRWSAGQTGDDAALDPLWQDLVAAHAELLLVGHDHTYQRYGRMGADGSLSTSGVREVVVGTGGEEMFSTLGTSPSLTVAQNTTFGVLKLVLHPTSYEATFLPIAGSTFTDSFTTGCVR